MFQFVVEAPVLYDRFYVYSDVWKLGSPQTDSLAKEGLLRLKKRVCGIPVATGMGTSSDLEEPERKVLNVSISTQANDMEYQDFREMLESFISAAEDIRKAIRSAINQE